MRKWTVLLLGAMTVGFLLGAASGQAGDKSSGQAGADAASSATQTAIVGGAKP